VARGARPGAGADRQREDAEPNARVEGRVEQAEDTEVAERLVVSAADPHAQRRECLALEGDVERAGLLLLDDHFGLIRAHAGGGDPELVPPRGDGQLDLPAAERLVW